MPRRRTLLGALGCTALAACGGVQLEIGGVPIGLSLSAVAQSPTQVLLSWTAYSGAFTTYAVYRDGMEIARTGATSYLDLAAEPDERHCYVVFVLASTMDALARTNEACVRTSGLAGGWDFADLGDGRQAAVALDFAGIARVAIAGDALPGLRYASAPLAGQPLVTIDARQVGGCALALDGFGRSHVAYGSSTGVRHASDPNGLWGTEVVDGTGGSLAPAIAIAGNGAPAIAYVRGSSVLLARPDAFGWDRDTIVGTVDPRLGPHRLAFGADGRARVLVASQETTGIRLRLLRDDGFGWQTLFERSGLPAGGGLALDASGAAVVAFWERNVASSDPLEDWQLLRVRIGPSIVSERVAFDSAPGGAPAVTVDAFGVQRIAWAAGTGRLEVATREQPGWSLETVTSGSFDGVDAVVGLDGRLHLVCRNRTRASILYAVG